MRVEDDLKPHNKETIEKILEFYQTEKKCCAIQATGTGKTFLILRLLEIYNDMDKVAVIFAPNKEIIKQTKKRMKKFGLNNAIFYTYQKLARMTDEEISNIETDLIVCDELHRTGAKTWGEKFEILVNTHPHSNVFGVTATPLRCSDGRDMTEEYFDGNKACNISLAEALVREIIPIMPIYVSALYTFEKEYQNMSDKIDKSRNSEKEKVELQEVLLAAKQQLEKANGVPEIIKKYITNYNGKYIVFCKDKEHLYAMKDVVVGWFRQAGYEGKIFEYPYYSNSSAVKKNLENFENNKEEGMKLLYVIDKLNEGLHLDKVDGCILLRTTVSNIIYYQQIGRVIDAGSDEKRVILDLVSNFNSLKSFNLKKDLEEKVRERQEGKFAECSVEFDLEKFDVVDCVQECVEVFNSIDSGIIGDSWTQKEDQIIAEKYPKGGCKEVAMILNRTKGAIRRRAGILGVYYENDFWTKDEDEIIINYYKSEGKKVSKRLIGRTEKACVSRAIALGIANKKNSDWTKEEDEILIKYYPIEGREAFNRLSNRSKKGCCKRVYALGIKTEINKSISNIWTDEETKVVKDLYENIGANGCKKYLPNKSLTQIRSKAQKLKLKAPLNKSSKYKYVTKIGEKYCVYMRIDGKTRYFGTSYDSEEEAGKVAMEKAKEYGKVI